MPCSCSAQSWIEEISLYRYYQVPKSEAEPEPTFLFSGAGAGPDKILTDSATLLIGTEAREKLLN